MAEPTRFCDECGARLERSSSKFCASCGTKIPSTSGQQRTEARKADDQRNTRLPFDWSIFFSWSSLFDFISNRNKRKEDHHSTSHTYRTSEASAQSKTNDVAKSKPAQYCAIGCLVLAIVAVGLIVTCVVSLSGTSETVISTPTPRPSVPTLTVSPTPTSVPSAALLAAPNIYNHYSREAPDNETIQFKGFPYYPKSGREGSETLLLHIHAVTNGNVVCVFPDTVENTIELAHFGATMPRPFVTFEGVVSEWVGSDLWIDSCRVLAIEKR